ncbi:MAG: 2-oxoglutarate and iron-dependent oxygenase domain-containing protein [Planctomycetota bacterium]|nr:2-oxoglutarate and iron-dependent oxygenase domain-containing protein [Planctomycetota bacterium]
MNRPHDGILDVDLLAFEQGSREARRAVIDGVMRSLATGFVYCRHDIPEGVIDDAYAHLKAFFHLSRDQKMQYVRLGSMGQTGYTGLLVEAAADAQRPDWKEMLNWGIELARGHPLRRAFPHRYMERVFPEDDVPGISSALELLYVRLLDLQRRFLRIIAVGIGCAPGFFDGMLEDGPTLCRAIRYPPMGEAPDGEFIWADAHGDINLITALPRATSRGLQVQVGEDGGEWIDAAPPSGHAILNTGMMLERVTNGRIPAGIHRVIADPGQSEERFSVVQFCHPTPRTILHPVSSCIDAEHPQRDGAIQAGDWLDQVLYDINLTEDARRLDS